MRAFDAARRGDHIVVVRDRGVTGIIAGDLRTAERDAGTNQTANPEAIERFKEARRIASSP